MDSVALRVLPVAVVVCLVSTSAPRCSWAWVGTGSGEVWSVVVVAVVGAGLADDGGRGCCCWYWWCPWRPRLCRHRSPPQCSPEPAYPRDGQSHLLCG